MGPETVAHVSAGTLIGVFSVAGLAKIVSPGYQLGTFSARAIGLLELALAAAILLVPRVGIPVAAFATAAFLVHSLSSSSGDCECFGQHLRIGRSRKAISVRNAALMTIAVVGAMTAFALPLGSQIGLEYVLSGVSATLLFVSADQVWSAYRSRDQHLQRIRPT